MNESSSSQSRPCVLVFSGLDPSGGAGIGADIEAIGATGAHALSVITALTVQDNDKVYAVNSVDADIIARQADVLIQKIPVAAVKIGIGRQSGQCRDDCRCHQAFEAKTAGFAARSGYCSGKWSRFCLV